MKIIIFFLAIFSLNTSFAEGLKVTTFNTGLAHSFVPMAKERFPQIINALKNQDADVLCLQEVWTKKDRKKLIKALAKEYPHTLFEKVKRQKSSKAPVCRRKQLFGEDKFVSCMQNKCGGLSGDAFTSCIIEKCGRAMEDLKSENRECAQALMARVGKNPILSIIALLNPFRKADLFAWKGSDGLLMLSKKPLKNKETIELSDISTLIRRRALYGEVEYEEKTQGIVCTHLTARLSTPYTGKFSSWEDEHKAQIQKLIDDMDKKSYPALIMGDMNCGFENRDAGLGAEWENNCQILIDAGFRSPIIEKEKPQCTYCWDNNLVSEGNDPKGHKDSLIDHIFIKEGKVLNSEVNLKQEVMLKTEDGIKNSRLSDHYGVGLHLE